MANKIQKIELEINAEIAGRYNDLRARLKKAVEEIEKEIDGSLYNAVGDNPHISGAIDILRKHGLVEEDK